MSDSDSTSGVIAHPLADQHTDTTDDSRNSTASSTRNTPPLMLEGGDSVLSTPIPPFEASMGFETPAPPRSADTDSEGGGSREYSRLGTGGKAQTRILAPGSPDEATPPSGRSTVTVKEGSSDAAGEAGAEGVIPQSEAVDRRDGDLQGSGGTMAGLDGPHDQVS